MSIMKHIIAKHWRQLLFIYTVQLGISLLVFYLLSTMFSSLNNTQAYSLIHRLDRTVLADFMQANPSAFDLFSCMSMILILGYMMISTFLNAGLIKSFIEDRIHIKSLLQYGAKYFWKMLCINGVCILSFLLIGTISFLSFFLIVGDPILYFDTERPFVHSMLFLSLMMLFLSFLIYVSILLVKIGLLRDLKLKSAWNIAKRKLWKSLMIVMFYLVLVVVVKQVFAGILSSSLSFFLTFFIIQISSIVVIIIRSLMYHNLLK